MKVLKKRHFSLFLLFFVVVVTAQELPPVINFQAKNYNAQNQNWAITQSKDNSIFIANNSGVLEYNGAVWRLYNSPNETIIRSIKAIRNKIFTGCYMEFGFWERNNLGELKYSSLTKKLNIQHKDDEQFWNIIELEEWILFQSLDRIYLYNTKNESIKVINSETTIIKIYKTNNNVYFQKKNIGLFKIENGKEKLFIKDSKLNNSRIVNVFDYNGNLLIATQNNGFFLFKNSKIKPWNLELLNKFPYLSIYNCIQLKDGSFALGTISNGIIYLDKEGKFQYSINQEKGLNDNTVLSLFEDKNNNIWLGLDNGISLVNQKSPFKIYNDFKGALGSIYASIIFQDKLYLGTNQGLFYKAITTNNNFQLVKGTKGQVWSLNVINNELFCGHDLGTFIINKDSSKKISSIQGTWSVKPVDNSNKILLQGNYDGLYILENTKGNWGIKNKVKGLDISSRYFEIINKNIFINHEYKGVLKLKVNNNFTSIVRIDKLPINKGLNSSLIKYNNNLFYSYKEGIFKYNSKENKFVKDSNLSSIYDDGYISGKLITVKGSNELWGFSKNNIDQITPSKLSNELKINRIPLINSLRKGVVGYENILKIDKDNYLLCSASGYITINLSQLEYKDFEVSINKVSKISYHKNTTESLLDFSVDETQFNNKDNNFSFSYNSPNFDKYLKTFYQYKLEGIYNSWSDWSESSEVFFENLPSGNYQFLVRAKIGNKISNNVASYKFSIAKPWYATSFMIFLYIASIMFFSLFMHTIYRKYYKNQQQKLIEQNKKEIELAQAKSEKEIIRIKNEKLREDFKIKSKELATTIMSVVKKNELLNSIKKQLSEVDDKEKIKPVINIIDKSLNQNDDWNFFQEAFNNADRDFLKNIKTKHPKLSPNDLKLCAYLRLNLSSKEIAPLFNISVRSVEIKRYRLRKKINLPHENNLVDYILSL